MTVNVLLEKFQNFLILVKYSNYCVINVKLIHNLTTTTLILNVCSSIEVFLPCLS